MSFFFSSDSVEYQRQIRQSLMDSEKISEKTVFFATKSLNTTEEEDSGKKSDSSSSNNWQRNLLVILMMLLFFVGLLWVLYLFVLHPYVQKVVSESAMMILDANLTTPSSTGFVLTAASRLNLDLPLRTYLLPSNLSVVFNGTQFGILTTPQVLIPASRQGESSFTIQGWMEVDNKAIFETFSSQLALNNTVDMNLMDLCNSVSWDSCHFTTSCFQKISLCLQCKAYQARIWSVFRSD